MALPEHLLTFASKLFIPYGDLGLIEESQIRERLVLISKIKLFFRRINSTLCWKAGHFNKALSKGPKTTTWIWNLHSDAHDFDWQERSTGLG